MSSVDLVGDLALLDLAVRRLDEAERVDPSVRREQPIRPMFGPSGVSIGHMRAVVRRVDVTDLHAGTVTGQTTGTQRRQATLVRQAGDRVGLVHELAQAGGAEELLQRRHHGTDVDQGLRRDRLDVLGRHPLADHALHAGQAGAELVLDQLADRAHAAVAEVVDVVRGDVERALGRLELLAAVVQRHDVLDRGDDVVDGQRLLVEGLVQAELLVDLVAADLGQVVALQVEVVVVQQRLAASRVGGSPGRSAVDVEQRVVLALGVVLLQGQHHRLVLAELLADLLVGPAEGLEQHRDVLLALAVQAHADHVALVDLELEPGAARRMSFAV